WALYAAGLRNRGGTRPRPDAARAASASPAAHSPAEGRAEQQDHVPGFSDRGGDLLRRQDHRRLALTGPHAPRAPPATGAAWLTAPHGLDIARDYRGLAPCLRACDLVHSRFHTTAIFSV